MKAYLTKKLELLLSAVPGGYRVFALYYRFMVGREFKRLPLRAKDRVLFVGGGALPLSAVYLHRKTGANVDILDCDERAVRLGRKWIASMGLSHALTMRMGRGKIAICQHYDRIHIAKQVMPKRRVLEHILNSVGPKTQVFVRKGRNDETFSIGDCAYAEESESACFYIR